MYMHTHTLYTYMRLHKHECVYVYNMHTYIVTCNTVDICDLSIYLSIFLSIYLYMYVIVYVYTL